MSVGQIIVTDVLPKFRGHFLAEVYEGDIVRQELSARELWENKREQEAALREGRLPEFEHRGRVLNRKVHEFGGDNLVVTVGKQMIMDRLYGLSAVGAMTRIGVGTSATAAAVGDTTLTGGVFVAFDSTPTRSSLTVTSITTFGTGTANINWQEMGTDNSTTLLARIAPIGPFNKTSAVSIIITYQLTQS